MRRTVLREVGKRDGNVFDRAALVLPRASGFGALTAVALVAAAVLGQALSEGDLTMVVPATVGVLFYVGVPAVILGGGTAFLACFLAVVLHDGLMRVHRTPTTTRWSSAAVAALLGAWPTVLCLGALDTPAPIVLVLVVASVLVSTSFGGRLLRRLSS